MYIRHWARWAPTLWVWLIFDLCRLQGLNKTNPDVFSSFLLVYSITVSSSVVHLYIVVPNYRDPLDNDHVGVCGHVPVDYISIICCVDPQKTRWTKNEGIVPSSRWATNLSEDVTGFAVHWYLMSPTIFLLLWRLLCFRFVPLWAVYGSSISMSFLV